jgi:hypothetical protein
VFYNGVWVCVGDKKEKRKGRIDYRVVKDYRKIFYAPRNPLCPGHCELLKKTDPRPQIWPNKLEIPYCLVLIDLMPTESLMTYSSLPLFLLVAVIKKFGC